MKDGLCIEQASVRTATREQRRVGTKNPNLLSSILFACLFGLLGLLTGALPGGAQAQQVVRYDVVLQGVPLEEALRQLLTKTDLNLAFDQRLVTDKRVYCVAEQSEAEDALRCVLNGTGLDFYRLSSGLYVLTELPEARPLVGTLQGIVVDGATGEPLPNAHVLLADGSMGTVSNDAGRFSFANLKPGTYRLMTSYIGYQNRVDSVLVAPAATAQARLTLDAATFTVTPIVVDGMQWRLPSDTLGQTVLSRQALLSVPNGGMPDIARSLNTLVGIRLSDATADLHVQGGETGEHQFRLDGAPVFIPVSIGGLVGPFSPFAIGRVTVHKAGFDAGVGSQSAGVIQAEHALGQAGPRTLDVQFDPMSVNARLGFDAGTPGTTTTSFLLAGRTGLWDLYAPSAVRGLLEDWNRTDPFMLSAFRAIPQQDVNTGPFFRRGFSTGNPGLGFLDTHAALRVRFGPLRSLHASAYWGRRRLDSEQDPFGSDVAQNVSVDEAGAVLRDTEPETRDRYVWNNLTAQIRYDEVLSGRMMASLRGRASLYRLRHDIVVANPIRHAVAGNADLEALIDLRDDNGNRIQEYAVEARLDYAAASRWTLEAGLEPTFTLSRFLVHGTRHNPIAHASTSWRLAGFVTNRVTLSRRATLDAGARFTYLAAPRNVYVEPRLAFRYDQPDSRLGLWSIRVATGLYRQFVNQFDVSSRSARALLATSRMWIGIDESVSPPHTAHLGGELLLQPGPGWTLRLEGYYKQHLHLLAVDYAAPTSAQAGPTSEAFTARNTADAFLAGDLPIPSQPQASFLAGGEGYAYGGAALVEKKWRRLRVEARYEYSQSKRSFGTFYDGNTITTPWNEPHRVELAFDVTPTDGLTLLGRWHSIWGRTWGFRQSYYDFLGAYRERLINVARTNTTPEETDFDVLSIHDIINHIIAYQLQHPEAHRLPPVHQLDLSVAYTRRLGATTAQMRLDLLNVFDSDNVADWRFAFDADAYRRRGLLIREERRLLPLTPSLALRLAW